MAPKMGIGPSQHVLNPSIPSTPRGPTPEATMVNKRHRGRENREEPLVKQVHFAQVGLMAQPQRTRYWPLRDLGPTEHRTCGHSHPRAVGSPCQQPPQAAA
jgi:hypothetical protein